MTELDLIDTQVTIPLSLSKDREPPVICLMGPTASGKTALAMALCENLPCDIISVDSALVFKGMNIGTAKPTNEELAQYPHKLIDLIDPAESYSAADFCRDALAEIAKIRAAGHKRAHSSHTYQIRIERILQDMKLSRKSI